MKTYYRPFVLDDLPEIINLRLRQADIDEIRASVGVSPAEALVSSLAWSTEAWVVIHEGKIEAVFGVSVVSDYAIPWFLATDKFKEFRFTFAKESKKVVKELLSTYKCLSNFVSSRHKESIRWLKWLGFTVDETAPVIFQDDNVPFYQFYMKEGSEGV